MHDDKDVALNRDIGQIGFVEKPVNGKFRNSSGKFQSNAYKAPKAAGGS